MYVCGIFSHLQAFRIRRLGDGAVKFGNDAGKNLVVHGAVPFQEGLVEFGKGALEQLLILRREGIKPFCVAVNQAGHHLIASV